MSRKLPSDRQPYDPAKAARERNLSAKPDIAPTPARKVVHKPGLRPLPPKAAE